MKEILNLTGQTEVLQQDCLWSNVRVTWTIWSKVQPNMNKVITIWIYENESRYFGT